MPPWIPRCHIVQWCLTGFSRLVWKIYRLHMHENVKHFYCLFQIYNWNIIWDVHCTIHKSQVDTKLSELSSYWRAFMIAAFDKSSVTEVYIFLWPLQFSLSFSFRDISRLKPYGRVGSVLSCRATIINLFRKFPEKKIVWFKKNTLRFYMFRFPNKSENCKYNLISAWFNKILKKILCVWEQKR